MRTMTTMALLGLFALLGGLAPAAAEDDAGEADRVEVVEFFWYGCPHCYRFQPHLGEWLDEGPPEHVEFKQVPALLSPGWEVHARAFYAAQLMGELDRFHDAFYDAIHADNQRLDSRAAIADFAASLGIDGERFASTMDSFAVENRLREARQLNRDYRVSGTPSVGVGGEYTISPSDAGSYAEMISLVEQRAASLHAGDGN